jgi:ABC-type branched-subunit amino acid transport system substrate-binding protein
MKPNKKLAVVVAAGLAALAVALLSGCGSSSSSSSTSSSASTSNSAATGSSSTATGKPVKVLAILDTGGADKAFETEMLAGLKGAAAYYNANGGILGRPVSIDVQNDASDPGTATSEAVSALSGNPGKYAMVLAGGEGTITATLLPIMARYKVFSTAINDGGAGTCATKVASCPTFFALTGTSAAYSAGDAQYLVSKHFKNVGLLEEQIDFTEGEAGAVQKYLTSHGVKVETATFPPTAVSVTPEMNNLKSGGAQAVFEAAVSAPAYHIFSARPALSWNVPLVLDIASSSGADVSKEVPAGQLKNSSETVWYCENPANTSAIPAFGLVGKWTSQAGSPLLGSDTCALVGIGWGAMVLLHDAAANAHSLSTAALVNATESLHETAKSSPFLSSQSYCWSSSSHDNLCDTASDYQVVPVGRIANLRIEPIK